MSDYYDIIKTYLERHNNIPSSKLKEILKQDGIKIPCIAGKMSRWAKQGYFKRTTRPSPHGGRPTNLYSINEGWEK